MRIHSSMKKSVAFCVAVGLSVAANAAEVSKYADPFWGCGQVDNPESQGMARGWNWLKAQAGNTHPGAVMPFGWVSACAFTGNYSSGYGRYGRSGDGPTPVVHKRPKAYGITHFHQSGTGYIKEFYNYFLTTPFVSGADTSKASCLDNEKAVPGYYSATLGDYGSSFELTTDKYAACHRYGFASGKGIIRIDANWGGLKPIKMPKGYSEKPQRCVVEKIGEREWGGYIRVHGLDVFFVIRSDGTREESCKDGIVTLMAEGKTAQTTIGFSLVSRSEAAVRAKAAADLGFDAVRKNAAEEWECALSRIKAEFADDEQKKLFYSTLYHSLVKPVDCGTGFSDYATMWDVYRTQIPLVLSLMPKVSRPIMLDMLTVSERLGFFPTAHLMHGEQKRDFGQAAALSVFSLSDGFFRGALTVDDYPRYKKVVEKQIADTDPLKGRSPTYALDYSGACFAAAEVARRCGDKVWARVMDERSKVWKQVYDSETGCLKQGENIYFYEGNYRNYSFRPHPGMVERVALAGGVGGYAKMLDDFFRVGYQPENWDPKKDRQIRHGYFEGLNNESDMETPFAYIWGGRVDRTVEVVDLVRRCRFSNGEGGCPGNNDSGGTSSWHVWACLGLYPYTGTPYYLIGSPSVESAEVDFLRGKLKIKVLRESAGSIYPIGYSFNGRDFREPWMEICELEKGGELVFKLSDKPMPGNTPVPPWFD